MAEVQKKGIGGKPVAIEWEPIKKVVFNLGDMFVFLGSTIIMLEQTAKSLAEVRKKK